MQCYICFLPGWSGAEMKCTVHVDLPKRPINCFKLDQQKRQQVLRAYCTNIYTVGCQNNCGDKDGDCTIEILSFSFEFSHGRVAAFSHYHSMTDVKSRRDVRAEKSPLRGFFASS